MTVTDTTRTERSARINGQPLLEIRDLEMKFPISRGLFRSPTDFVHAVDGINFQIAPGESFDGPGPGVCALFADMGWPMGPDCLGQIVNPANEPLAADSFPIDTEIEERQAREPELVEDGVALVALVADQLDGVGEAR